MKGGSAGAIILVGFGVLFLNLAYTGRGAAVWAALRGSGDAAATEAPSGQAADEATDQPAEEDGPGGGGGRGFDKKKSDKPQAGAGSAWRTVRIN